MKKLSIYNQVISCAFFSLLGLQVKLLLDITNIESIVFFRSFIGLVLILIISTTLKKGIKIVKTSNIKIHILRSIFGTMAMYFGYRSLSYISLSEATSIGFTKVFFTSILAFFFLKEKLNLFSLILVFTGFFGVYLIALPTQTSNLIGLYMSIFSALCVAGGIISISFLAKLENTLTVMIYHSFFSTIVFLVFFLNKIEFNLYHNFLSIILLTITALAGQYFNSESYRYGKTNSVIILGYSRIVFSTLLGFFFLGEKISIITIFGILVIALTTYFVKKD